MDKLIIVNIRMGTVDCIMPFDGCDAYTKVSIRDYDSKEPDCYSPHGDGYKNKTIRVESFIAGLRKMEEKENVKFSI